MDEEVVELNNQMSKKEKVARIMAIVIFSTIFGALTLEIVSDIAIFSDQIMGFIGACISAVGTFIVACVFLFFSIVLVFGVYLLKKDGFWPLIWATSAFHSVLKDYEIAPWQLTTLIGIRVALIIICFLVFVTSIVVLSLMKSVKKENPERKQKLTKSFGIVSLIFSILGMLAAAGIILIISAIA